MIWRSRSLSARSSKSIALSRPGSSGSPEAEEVTNRLDQSCQALIPCPDEENPSLANAASSALDPPGPLRPGRFRSLRLGITITLTHVDELFCSAWNSRHRDLPRRVHPFPIEPFEQDGELGCREPHHPVPDLGPAELALFQPLGDENHARAIPEHQLDPVSALGPEHIDRARERVGVHRLTHKRREAIGPFAEVHRPGRHQDANRAGGPDHGPTFSARITAAIACGLAPDPIRTTVPSISTTIPMTGPCRRARRGCGAGGSGGREDGSTTAGTNRAGALGPRERRASRRQVNNCAGVSPCRRATPHTVRPGASLSATMAAFSSADQLGRRPAPVNTSRRRARSGLGVSSEIDMGRSSKPAPNVTPHAWLRKALPRRRLLPKRAEHRSDRGPVLARVAAAGRWGQIRASLTYRDKKGCAGATEPGLGCRRAGARL